MTVENKESQEKIRIVVNLTEAALDCIDLLVRQGVFMNRQTVIRAGVRSLLESRKMFPFYLPEPKVESA